MYQNNPFSLMISHLHRRPNAVAVLRGSDAYPQLIGEVRFYQLADSVLIAAEVSGLPMADAPC